MRIKSNKDQLAKIFQQKLDQAQESDHFHLVENLIPDSEKENSIKKDIENDIIKSFRRISDDLNQKNYENPNAFLFEFAGADISPYIPTTCWINGHIINDFSDNSIISEKLIFDCTGGFDLELLEPLCEILEENEDVSDFIIYKDVKWVLIYKTFLIATEVIVNLLENKSFSDLFINKPFYFLSKGGHDEDIELFVLVE